LDRIFTVAPFSNSPQLRRFLQFVIMEALAGRGAGLDQHSIARCVFDLGPEFEPDSNAIVRVNANRLRRALDKYYADHGPAEPVLIRIPTGSYSPSMVYNSKHSLKACLPLPAPVLALVEFQGIRLEDPWKQFPLLLIEELSVCLGRVSQLRLMGPFRRAVLLARDQPPAELGRQQPLDFILDGSVEQIGDQLVIHSRLLEGGTGLEIWARHDRCPLAAPAIAELKAALIQQIAMEVFADFGAMDQHLCNLAKVKPENSLTVFESVLSGRMYYESFDPEALRRGSIALRRAIELVPEEALPRATLATLLAGACFQPFWRDEVPHAEVAEHARRAYEIDPRNCWSSIALGASAVIHRQRDALVRLGQRVDADRDAGKLLQGATGVWLIYQNVETELGLRLIGRAREGNPHHPPSFHLGLCLAALQQGDWQAVLWALEDFGRPDDWRDPLIRAAAAVNLGDPAAARGHWQRLLALYPDFAARGFPHTGRLWHEDHLHLLGDGLNRAGARISL
jgi:TolB-like protein